MNINRILEKIQNGEIKSFNEEVNAQYDPSQQTPLGFRWRGVHYEVLKKIQVTRDKQGCFEYLLLTDKGAFCLLLKCINSINVNLVNQWLLKYQVIEDEKLPVLGKKSIFDSPLKKISMAFVSPVLATAAYYHGHLCPELALGYRVSTIAFEHLGLTREESSNYYIIAENMSSSVEALQLITGCTIGNHNFFAYDDGKHVYYIGRFADVGKTNTSLRIAMINSEVQLNGNNDVEERILTGKAEREEIDEYQSNIGDSVEQILRLSDEQLFSINRISLIPPKPQCQKKYTRCSRCSEVVEVSKCIINNNSFYCRSCKSSQYR